MAIQKFLRVIGDYGQPGDLAFSEVTDALRYRFRKAGIDNVTIDLTSVPAFDTYATGFTLAQLANNNKLGDDQLFYVNTAPRKDNKSARINNEGEGLVYARLKNGARIIAVNSGYSLTLVKPWAEEIRELDVSNRGTQFRSRDLFPVAPAAILAGNDKIIGKDVMATVPDQMPENRVVYTDGYGNLKCNIRPESIKHQIGLTAIFNIEGSKTQWPAQINSGMFAVADGEGCLFKGSSGWALPDGGRMEFCELAVRGGNAAEIFGKPEGGALVQWRIPDRAPKAA